MEKFSDTKHVHYRHVENYAFFGTRISRSTFFPPALGLLWCEHFYSAIERSCCNNLQV